MTKICPRCHQRLPCSAGAPSTPLGPDARPTPEDADEMRIVQIVMVIMLVLGFLLLVKIVVHGATL